MARPDKPYLIYALWSPSGKAYVGLTSMTAERRWYSHVRRAVKEQAAHPLSAAIRKYGPESFSVEVLESGLTKAEAQLRERHHIAALGTQTPGGYNVSPGGEADGHAGAARLRELLKDDAWRADYLGRLRAACVDRVFQPDIAALSQKWRSENPKRAWANGYRASRVAARSAGKDKADPRFGAWGRLHSDSPRVASARRAYFARNIVGGVWARRSDVEVAAIGAKIGASLSATHARNPEKIKATLAVTRRHIDRAKQAANASAGLKGWWAELRKDPARYAAYIESRIKTRKAA